MSGARWLAAALLAGCARTPIGPSAPDADGGSHSLPLCRQVDAGPAPSGEAAVRAAPAVALAQLRDHVEECSNAGGAHLVFALKAPSCGPDGWAPGLARQGEHTFRDAHAAGSWAVVGVDPTRPVAAGGEAGWCLESLPAAEATVVGVVWVASEAEGQALLASLGP